MCYCPIYLCRGGVKMYKLSGLSREIDIQLNCGVYVFSRQSAEGKTFLSKMLNNYGMDGKNVISFTYNNFRNGLSLDTLLNGKHYDVVMLDRYDMYFGQFEDTIERLGKESIVLIDSKKSPEFKISPRVCTIRFDLQRIKVSK